MTPQDKTDMSSISNALEPRGAPNRGDSVGEETSSTAGGIQSQARQYGDKNLELPEELQDALKVLLDTFEEEDLYQRRAELILCRQNYFYERGYQHYYYNPSQGIFILGTGGEFADADGGGGMQCEEFIDDWNIFGRACQILVAKLTEKVPEPDFQPDTTDQSECEQARSNAEAFRLYFDLHNNAKNLALEIAMALALSGRTVLWTRTLADAQRWGVDKHNKPVTCETTTVHSVLETKVPILALSQGECPYLVIKEDPHELIARERYPQIADKIATRTGDDSSEDSFERICRIGILQGAAPTFNTSEAYNNHVEVAHAFFRPSAFMSKKMEGPYADPDQQDRRNEDGEPWTLRDALKEAFPDGALVTFCAGVYADSQNVCLDDQIKIVFPVKEKGMAQKPLMEDAIVIQDNFNDDMNCYTMAKRFGWPSTWVNVDKMEVRAINSQRADPYCWRALEGGGPKDRAFADMFFREPDPGLPESFTQHTEYLAVTLLQYVLAIPSAVQGGGMPDQKTASGYNAALQQAMGQLGVPYSAIIDGMAAAYQQAAVLASRRAKEDGLQEISIPTPQGFSRLDMGSLGKGRFMTHADPDSGFPESTIQQRATLMTVLQVMGQDPEAAAALRTPDNAEYIFDKFGLKLTIPEALSRKKQLAEIELLVLQSPMAQQGALEEAMAQHAAAGMVAQQGAGEPPQPFNAEAVPKESTVPVSPLDFHQWEFEICREKLSDFSWIQSQLAVGRADGIENIKLHAMEHLKFLPMLQAEIMGLPSALPAPAPGAPAPHPHPGVPTPGPKPIAAPGGMNA
jgi:hypothetical protein